MLAPVTPSPEESTELFSIMNQIDTYREEMVIKFILGLESLDNFDKYLAQIKKLGIDRAVRDSTGGLEALPATVNALSGEGGDPPLRVLQRWDVWIAGVTFDVNGTA